MVRLILLSSRPPAASGDESATQNLSPAQPSLMLAACAGPDARAQRVIDHAVGMYRADCGFLFGVRQAELILLATNGERAPPNEMVPALTERITNMLGAQRTLTVEAHAFAQAQASDARPDDDLLASYTVIPLVLEASAQESEQRVLGAIVLSGVSVHAGSVSERFVRRCTEMLYESADISALRVQD
jgi:hypothetical protein